MINLASNNNSPDRSTKSTRSSLNGLPQLVNTGFQVLFHSPPGVLFTFPSQYYSLSVTEEYLALRGGPRSFTQSSTCFVLLWILPLPSEFVYGIFTLSDQISQNCSAIDSSTLCSPQPRGARTTVWALSISLAATLEIEVSFFSSGYLDVSVPFVPFLQLCIGCRMTEVYSARFPHSDIYGSKLICSSP